MRFFPHPDPHIYFEIQPAWSKYCRNPNLSWKQRKLQPKHQVLYWRDIDGKDIRYILKKDLEFENWPVSRIRWEACLPLYYCVGARFIRLDKTLVGFKCREMPLNLEEARAMKAYLQKLDKERKRLAKLERARKKAEKKALKKAQKKSKGK